MEAALAGYRAEPMRRLLALAGAKDDDDDDDESPAAAEPPLTRAFESLPLEVLYSVLVANAFVPLANLERLSRATRRQLARMLALPAHSRYWHEVLARCFPDAFGEDAVEEYGPLPAPLAGLVAAGRLTEAEAARLTLGTLLRFFEAPRFILLFEHEGETQEPVFSRINPPYINLANAVARCADVLAERSIKFSYTMYAGRRGPNSVSLGIASAYSPMALFYEEHDTAFFGFRSLFAFRSVFTKAISPTQYQYEGIVRYTPRTVARRFVELVLLNSYFSLPPLAAAARPTAEPRHLMFYLYTPSAKRALTFTFPSTAPVGSLYTAALAAARALEPAAAPLNSLFAMYTREERTPEGSALVTMELAPDADVLRQALGDVFIDAAADTLPRRLTLQRLERRMMLSPGAVAPRSAPP